MVKTRTRSLAVIAAGALLLAPLAGCGGSDEKKSDDTKSSSTSTATAGADGDSDNSDSSDSSDSGTDEVEGKEIDADDFIAEVVGKMRSQKTAHMVIDIGSSMTANADVSYGAQAAMKMTMTTGGQTMEAILLGETMYLKTTPSTKYYKIDKNTPGSEAILGQFENLGPEQSISQLKGAVKKVIEVGPDEVDGDDLIKYALTVDTSKIAQQLGQAVAGADLPRMVTYSMWLDSDKLLRRVEMDVSGQKVTMKVTDWGKKLDIKAPAASLVVKQP